MPMRQARKQVYAAALTAFERGKNDFLLSLTEPLYRDNPHNPRGLKGINWEKGYQVGLIEYQRDRGLL